MIKANENGRKIFFIFKFILICYTFGTILKIKKNNNLLIDSKLNLAKKCDIIACPGRRGHSIVTTCDRWGGTRQKTHDLRDEILDPMIDGC